MIPIRPFAQDLEEQVQFGRRLDNHPLGVLMNVHSAFVPSHPPSVQAVHQSG